MCRPRGDQCWTSPHYCNTACCPSGLGNDPLTGISHTVKKSVLHFSPLLARHAVLVFDEFSIGYRNRRLGMGWTGVRGRGGGGGGGGKGTMGGGRGRGSWLCLFTNEKTLRCTEELSIHAVPDTLRSCPRLFTNEKTRCQIHWGIYTSPPPRSPPPPPHTHTPCLLAVKCSETTSLSKSDPYFSPSLSILLHSLHQTLVLTATARWLSTSGPQTETAQPWCCCWPHLWCDGLWTELPLSLNWAITITATAPFSTSISPPLPSLTAKTICFCCFKICQALPCGVFIHTVSLSLSFSLCPSIYLSLCLSIYLSIISPMEQSISVLFSYQ